MRAGKLENRICWKKLLAVPESWNSTQNREQKEPNADWTWNTDIHAASPDFQTIKDSTKIKHAKITKIDRKI